MRVLVLTNHFSEFAGSEIIALEVAQWFVEQGDQVALAANFIRPPISDLGGSIELLRDIDDIDLSSFDLVWCQHGLLSLLPFASFAAAAMAPPLVALVSLSPFEPYEHVAKPEPDQTRPSRGVSQRCAGRVLASAIAAAKDASHADDRQ
jgi:hypothetical protein